MGGGGKKGKGKRRRNDDDEEEEDEMTEKHRRVSGFFEVEAVEADSDEDSDYDDNDDDDGFIVKEHGEEIPDDYADDNEISHRSPLLRARRDDDEEEDIDAMEKMVNERYTRAARDYDDDSNDEATLPEQESLFPSVYGPKLWMVKCLPGHEKEVAASLTYKADEQGSEARIQSAFALDHLKSYIYVKAYKEADVKEACKGIHYILSKNITMVPLKEMNSVLSGGNKSDINVSKGDWVRLKRSSYKGSLAKVVDVDDIALKVTVKVAPSMSSLSLDDKLDGINSFYKTVALSSITTGNVKPSFDEVQNFRETGETDEELASLFKEKHDCWVKGDSVMVVEGELQNLEGTIEYVEGNLVHIKPNVKMPMKTVTVRKSEIVKYFEAGSQVKVVNGVHEGATGMVVKVDQNKLIILSDASKDQITVFAGQVVKTTEISESSSVGGGQGNRVSAGSSRHVAQTASASRPPHGLPRPSSGGRGGGQFVRRNDSMIGKNVKITQGPYRGYRGCVKGVNGHSVRVELEAQMKVIIVQRNQISDNLSPPSTNWKMQQGRPGSETPLYPQTPMHSMGGETPWRTPRPSTPVHRGSATPSRDNWNPLSLVFSPTRLTPTP